MADYCENIGKVTYNRSIITGICFCVGVLATGFNAVFIFEFTHFVLFLNLYVLVILNLYVLVVFKFIRIGCWRRAIFGCGCARVWICAA